MPRPALLLAILALLAAAAAAGAPHARAAEVTAHGAPLALAVEPVALGEGRLAPGVALLGAWVLRADSPDFGGISGILVEGDRLTGLTDRAHWIEARIDPAAEPPLAEARIAPMLGAGGRPLAGAAIDAESIARTDGALWVGFEQDHRLMRHAGGGRLSDPLRPRDFGRLGANAGVEGLATLPDGSLLAIAESREADAFPVWVLRPRGAVRRGRLPARTIHDVTSAEIGPDGRLYLLQRHFSVATGVSMRLVGYAIGPEGLPDPASEAELALYDSASGIDNMEALAVVPDPGGGLLLWILADDNFNPPQRTILLLLRIAA